MTAVNWNERVRAVAERHDRQAFTEIFDHFVPRLETYLGKLGLDGALAEEITQEVMLTVWRKAALFDPAKSSLATWLYRIARNRRIDLARRMQAERADSAAQDMAEIADDRAIDEDIDRLQRDGAVRRLIGRLPAEQERLVRMAFYEGFAHAEIAEKTGLPLGTVKSRLRLAFARLRRALNEEGIDESG